MNPHAGLVAYAGYGEQPLLLDGMEKRGLPNLVAIPSLVRFRRAPTVEEDPATGHSRHAKSGVVRTRPRGGRIASQPRKQPRL